MTTARAKLSVRDQEKPFILIVAIVVGILLNRFVGGVVQGLYGLVNVGLFVVIYAIMLFVEVKDVGKAFTKVKPTILALLTNFVFTPFFAWFLGWLFLRNYPDLWAGVVLYKLTPCIGWYLIANTIRRLLKQLKFSLRVNQKELAGEPHPQRDDQFEYIAAQKAVFQAMVAYPQCGHEEERVDWAVQESGTYLATTTGCGQCP